MRLRREVLEIREMRSNNGRGQWDDEEETARELSKRGNDWSDEEYMTFVSLIAVSAQLLPSIVKTQTTSIVPGTTHAYTKLFGLTDTKAHKEEKKAMNAH